VEHNRDEPGYDQTNPEQQMIDRAVNDQVEAMVRGDSSAHWEQIFQEHGVPVSRVQFVEELADHPQVVENEYMVALDHDLSGPQQMAAPPWKMSESPPAAQGAAPPLGRDTDAVLTAAGYSENEVTAMRTAGVIL
jgi:crotonobetainyl-CoA:carnitine CoA-transferase CaiB-like acyl-CoA transferase